MGCVHQAPPNTKAGHAGNSEVLTECFSDVQDFYQAFRIFLVAKILGSKMAQVYHPSNSKLGRLAIIWSLYFIAPPGCFGCTYLKKAKSEVDFAG